MRDWLASWEAKNGDCTRVGRMGRGTVPAFRTRACPHFVVAEGRPFPRRFRLILPFGPPAACDASLW